MLNYEDQPEGCRNEEYQSRPVKNSKPTEMENNYASIITAVMERFSAQK